MSGIGDCQRAGFCDGAELGGEGKKAEVSVYVGEEKIAATTPTQAVLSQKLGAKATNLRRPGPGRARPAPNRRPSGQPTNRVALKQRKRPLQTRLRGYPHNLQASPHRPILPSTNPSGRVRNPAQTHRANSTWLVPPSSTKLTWSGAKNRGHVGCPSRPNCKD